MIPFECRWCSGIMQDSHFCDPGSIPGRCIFCSHWKLLFMFLVNVLRIPTYLFFFTLSTVKVFSLVYYSKLLIKKVVNKKITLIPRRQWHIGVMGTAVSDVRGKHNKFFFTMFKSLFYLNKKFFKICRAWLLSVLDTAELLTRSKFHDTYCFYMHS